MKKYFRTKDGRIIDFTRLFISMVGRKPYAKETVGLLTDASIIRQSDDIEELFDYMLEVCPDEMEPVSQVYRRDKDGKLYRYWRPNEYAEPAKGNIIRGAIWTDKGLIYVAKMNKKGEWELL